MPPETVEVAIPLPVEQTFNYLVPESMKGLAVTGLRVLVPFGRRRVTGYILGKGQSDFKGESREIAEILDRQPLFTPQQVEFYRWIAAYYLHPLGEVIKTALPAGLTIMGRRQAVTAADGSVVSAEVLAKGVRCREENYYLPTDKECPVNLKGKAVDILRFLHQHKGASAGNLRQEFGSCSQQLQRLVELDLVVSEKREFYRSPFNSDHPAKDAPHTLNSEQQSALAALRDALASDRFSPFLLHGVTGSGKTEVYLQTIADALQLGKTALVLVPEIALTPQLVGRFRQRFSCGIAVLHSGISPGERYDEWRRITRGEAEIVIGARSAIFAPLARIGVIVIDEEHEATYKQSDGLRYNARDLALVLGKQLSGVVILGSATPLVSTVYAARNGRMRELALPNRVNYRPMPETILLDQRGKKNTSLSPALIDALQENLANGGQALLLLNRRGFATWLVCLDCGSVLSCPNCSVTLTYHQKKGRHICHYCDYSIPAPSVCPGCSGGEIGLFGAGTERLEEDVAKLIPEARLARMDRDTTSGKGGHARVLKQFENGAVDILIGTQMIAKGHDFPGVTIVGVISADTALNLPDFRGGERAFQLVSQVLGRAGRGGTPGRVLVQTLNPDHFALRAAVGHDYEAFYREEIAQRLDAGYPPYTFLAAVHFSGNVLQAVEDDAKKAAALLRQVKKGQKLRLEILGPASAPLGRIRGRYRWHILLKSPQRGPLHTALKQLRSLHRGNFTVRMALDIDPQELL